MTNGLPQQNAKAIQELTHDFGEIKGDLGSVKAEMSFLRVTVDRIENNHLAHLASDVKDTNKKLDDLARSVGDKLSGLQLVDAERRPAYAIGMKILEVIIMGVIVAIMGLVVVPKL